MKNHLGIHFIYWILVLVFLTVFFGFIWESKVLAFYFSSLLLPIVIGTTYFFNFFLVPKYLLKGKYRLFALYFFYMLVVSLYLEMLVALFSFLLLAETNAEIVKIQGISIFNLGITLYLIVFASSFIRILMLFKEKSKEVASLQTNKDRNEQESILVRADRKNQQILLSDLLYIESLSDYVKLVTTQREITTREKISSLDTSLPDNFIRVHRSFIINKDKVSSFSTTEVKINSISIPISRTYKKSALEVLEDQKIIRE